MKTNETKTFKVFINQDKFSCYGSGRYGCSKGKNLHISILRKDSHTWDWSVCFLDVLKEGETESLWRAKETCISVLSNMMIEKWTEIRKELEE